VGSLDPEAKIEVFNACDGCSFTMARFSPKFAERYGLKTTPPDETTKYHGFTLPYKTPPGG